MSDAYIRVVQVDGPAVTGDFTISASGETATPKGLIFLVTQHVPTTGDGTAQHHLTFNVGVTDGTSEACVSIDSETGQGTTDTGRASNNAAIWDQYLNGTQKFLASALTGGSAGPIAGGWTINISAETVTEERNAVAILFFGDDMQCYAGIGDMSTQDTAVTQTPGFQIHGGLFAGIQRAIPGAATVTGRISVGLCDYDGVTITQRACAYNSVDAAGTSDISGGTSTDSVNLIHASTALYTKIELSNITSTQFDLTTKLDTGVNNDSLYLVWNVADNPHKLENVAVPTSTGVATLSTENCANGVFGIMSHATANDTRYTDGNAGAFGVFGADSVAEHSLAIADEDNQGTSDTQSMYDAKIFNIPDHTGAAGIVGTVANLSTAGLDVNYTAVEASANQGFLYSIGNEAASTASTRNQSGSWGLFREDYATARNVIGSRGIYRTGAATQPDPPPAAAVESAPGGGARRRYPRRILIGGEIHWVKNAAEERRLLAAYQAKLEAERAELETNSAPPAEIVKKKVAIVRTARRLDSVDEREDEWLARLRREDEEILLLLH